MFLKNYQLPYKKNMIDVQGYFVYFNLLLFYLWSPTFNTKP